MLIRTGGGDDWSPVTNFEKSSHQQLHAMIADAEPAAVLQVGASLSSAGTQMQSLADDLSQHIAGLQWSGSAADAFTGWARQVVSATDTLSTYANNTGVAVTMAGTQLASTKAGMPPVPTHEMTTVANFKRQQQLAPNSGVNFDGTIKDPSVAGMVLVPPGGITQSEAFAAQTKVQSAYQEALGQMEGLGGAYVGAVSTMGVSTVPVFPPLPNALMPPPPERGVGSVTDVSGPGAASSGSGSSYASGGTVGGAGSVGKNSSSTGTSGAKTLVPVQPPAVGGGSNGGSTTLQGASPTPIAPSPTPKLPTPTGNGGSGGGPSNPVVPPPGFGTGGLGGSGGGGGLSYPGGGGSSDGGTYTGPGRGVVEGDPGISGGSVTATAAGGSYGGTAIGGAEGAGVLANAESGGLVGGSGLADASSTAQSGIGGAVMAEGSSAGVAGNQGAGEMMPMGMGGMGGMGGSGSKRRGRRPGYLVEDEETWTTSSGTNPAVIE